MCIYFFVFFWHWNHCYHSLPFHTHTQTHTCQMKYYMCITLQLLMLNALKELSHLQEFQTIKYLCLLLCVFSFVVVVVVVLLPFFLWLFILVLFAFVFLFFWCSNYIVFCFMEKDMVRKRGRVIARSNEMILLTLLLTINFYIIIM